MKKIITVTLMIMLTIGLAGCGFIINTIGGNDGFEEESYVEENDSNDEWTSDSLGRISFDIKESWDAEPFYSEDPENYEGVGYCVRGEGGKILFTINVFREGDNTADEIVNDEDYAAEEGVEVKNYKFKKWEQGEFKGYSDSWKAVYTDDAVDMYENVYYYGLTINDNASYGQGVVFDFIESAYTVNYEIYSTDKNDKSKATTYLKKIIDSLKENEHYEENEKNNDDSNEYDNVMEV